MPHRTLSAARAAWPASRTGWRPHGAPRSAHIALQCSPAPHGCNGAGRHPPTSGMSAKAVCSLFYPVLI